MSETLLKPIDAGDFYDLHARIGIALWRCQAFEDSLVSITAIVLKMSHQRAESEVTAMVTKLRKKTLGNLFKELEKTGRTDAVQAYKVRVEKLISERNWLAHRSFREHGADLYNPDRLPQLIERIDDITSEANALLAEYDQLVIGWKLSSGYTRDQIDAATIRILKQDNVIDSTK